MVAYIMRVKKQYEMAFLGLTMEYNQTIKIICKQLWGIIDDQEHFMQVHRAQGHPRLNTKCQN